MGISQRNKEIHKLLDKLKKDKKGSKPYTPTGGSIQPKHDQHVKDYYKWLKNKKKKK